MKQLDQTAIIRETRAKEKVRFAHEHARTTLFRVIDARQELNNAEEKVNRTKQDVENATIEEAEAMSYLIQAYDQSDCILLNFAMLWLFANIITHTQYKALTSFPIFIEWSKPTV
ncbi:hypothetical protein EG68_04074 [Paragonimus skrjabini miyazakii]|uniref:Uncharacterized protein n=1 Tax=Paragonimus skrjabini miyazakii TaxID=59628 RepID=A0A8S9Z2G7_9TREM|nr:hypothetical protein EG68_04074 [Paragonimus skrjabini miyazakii]